MRLILNSHVQVTCLDEDSAYRSLEIQPAPVLAPTEWLGYKIPRFTEQLADPIWADEGLDRRFPNQYRRQKVIFMLRNPADTIASMIKYKLGKSDWLQTWFAHSPRQACLGSSTGC